MIGLLAFGLLAIGGCAQQAATAAAGAATDAVLSVATAGGQTNTSNPPRGKWVGVKPNGRGGFDASVAQKAALAKAHYMRDHRNDLIKPFRPSTQPTTQPTTPGR